MSDEEMQITTADRLEIVAIVAGGGNGVEYVEVCGLIETATKELREKDAEILRLRAQLLDERERCALEADKRAKTVGNGNDEYSLACRHIADAIRKAP